MGFVLLYRIAELELSIQVWKKCLFNASQPISTGLYAHALRMAIDFTLLHQLSDYLSTVVESGFLLRASMS